MKTAIAGVVLGTFVCLPAAAQKPVPQPAHQPAPQPAWLTSSDAVVDDILAHLNESARAIIRAKSRAELDMANASWGAYIREHYGMTRGNDALLQDTCGKPCHPDNASIILMERAWEALQDDPSVEVGVATAPVPAAPAVKPSAGETVAGRAPAPRRNAS